MPYVLKIENSGRTLQKNNTPELVAQYSCVMGHLGTKQISSIDTCEPGAHPEFFIGKGSGLILRLYKIMSEL
jgi:hypothetical protein